VHQCGFVRKLLRCYNDLDLYYELGAHLKDDKNPSAIPTIFSQPLCWVKVGIDIELQRKNNCIADKLRPRVQLYLDKII
jgi:hypothetical protein